MAGHSKWANIKHKKAKEDAKRGKIYTKLIREITVAARLGGGDQSANPRLRAAVMDALSNNMPKDTIERAVKKGSGESDAAEQIKEVVYEGYGANGVAVMVYCMTDNINRTVSEVRHAFTKCGGNLGTDGSVAYLFKKVGLILYSSGVDEEQVVDMALEMGADDVLTNANGSIEVITAWENVHEIKEKLNEQGLPPQTAEVIMLPSTQVTLERDAAEKVLRLLNILEDLDDVQNVYSNANISDELLGELA